MHFERYVVVDWSAAARPVRGRDSIWIAAVDTASGAVEMLINPATRHEARHQLERLLDDARTTCLGVDFSLGYPSGTLAALGLTEWAGLRRLVAEWIVDEPDNHNNRFEVAAELNRRIGDGPGPFWGCPTGMRLADLEPRKSGRFPSASGVGEFRRCEQVLRGQGHWVSSSWQLMYAGAVGSQTLTGLAMLDALLNCAQFAERIAVWPFDDGTAAARSSGIVVCEVWPGAIPFDPTLHPVRDAAQMLGLAAHLAAADRAGQVGSMLSTDATRDVPPEVVREEGWILGVSAL